DHRPLGIVALGKDLGEGLLIGVVKVFFQIHRTAVLQFKGVDVQAQCLVVGIVEVHAQVNRAAVLQGKGIVRQVQRLVVRVDPRYVDGVPTADLKVGAGQSQDLLIGVVQVHAQVNRAAVLQCKGIARKG